MMQNRQEFLLDKGTCFLILWFLIMQMKRVNVMLLDGETVLAQVPAVSRIYHCNLSKNL